MRGYTTSKLERLLIHEGPDRGPVLALCLLETWSQDTLLGTPHGFQ